MYDVNEIFVVNFFTYINLSYLYNYKYNKIFVQIKDVNVLSKCSERRILFFERDRRIIIYIYICSYIKLFKNLIKNTKFLC